MTRYSVVQSLIAFLLYIFLASPLFAFIQEELTDKQLEEMMEGWEPLQVTGDAIAWNIFADTGEVEECTIDEEGYDYCIIKPEYSDAIKKLDGMKVTLMGFMFPLEPTDKQYNFLLGPYPLSCPFHYHVGPSQMVEVFVKKPVTFSYDPIVVEGVLSLRFNEETGMFFYLENASEK